MLPVATAWQRTVVMSAVMYECRSTWDDLSSGGGGAGGPIGVVSAAASVCLQVVLTPHISEFDPAPPPLKPCKSDPSQASQIMMTTSDTQTRKLQPPHMWG